VSLTITLPLPDTKWGPGFDVRAISDFIGPLEPDSFWRITLTAPPNEDILGVMIHPTVTHVLLTPWVAGSLEFPSYVGARDEWTTGQPAQLQVELVEPIGGVIEDEAVQIVLDREAGQVMETLLWIQQRLQVPNQALTTEQGEQLTRIESSVTTTIGPGVIDLVTGLSGLIVHPALSLGHLVFPGYDLTGDGTIPDLNSATSQAFGLHWTATIPAGFGHLHGQSEEYTMRLWQVRTVHTTGGQEVVTEVQDFHTEGDLWMWQTALPTRIEYSVTPGVVIHAQWWRVGV